MSRIAAANMERIEVVSCINGDGWDAKELECASDADGNFASIGDENFVDGRSRRL